MAYLAQYSKKMNDNGYILGIDTSNYKTSVAVTDRNNNIICDFRRFLKVKRGDRGLRQSDALFQHIKNLPELMQNVRDVFDGSFSAVSYSDRPRPAEGSYMPVFLAGESLGKSLASAMNIPCFSFSHQEGHIEAIKTYSSMSSMVNFLACHFSGGTCELLNVAAEGSGYSIKIIGGTRDISLGQVIDRAGVAMGMEFPAGEEMDRAAIAAAGETSVLTPVKVKDGWFNLSGIDTQIKRILSQSSKAEPEFIREIFVRLSDSVSEMLIQGAQMTGINDILMAGGVSSSTFMRDTVTGELEKKHINAVFDDNNLSQDNVVGTALLGGRQLWH